MAIVDAKYEVITILFNVIHTATSPAKAKTLRQILDVILMLLCERMLYDISGKKAMQYIYEKYSI